MKVKLPSEEAGWSLCTRGGFWSQQRAAHAVMSVQDFLHMPNDHSLAMAEESACGDKEVPSELAGGPCTHRGP